MTSFSLASEMRADGIHLFESGNEVGLIKRENGHWIIFLFDKPSPITFGSLQAAQYYALACYIETVWLGRVLINRGSRDFRVGPQPDSCAAANNIAIRMCRQEHKLGG